MLHLTIKITVAIPFKHQTLIQCCFNVGLASQTMMQIYKSTERQVNVCTGHSEYDSIRQTNIYLFKSTKLRSSKSEVEFPI